MRNLIKTTGPQLPSLSLGLVLCFASTLLVAAAPALVEKSERQELASAPTTPALRDVSAGAAGSPKVDAFALVGTAMYDRKTFAFFDGNDSNYKQLLHPGEKIAGCTLVAVAHDHVTLKSNNKLINLPVKTELRRENGGEWKQLELTENFTPATTPVETAKVSASSSSPVISGSRSAAPSTGKAKASSAGGFDGLSAKALKKLESEFKTGMKIEKEIKSIIDAENKFSKSSSKRSRIR